VLNDAIQAPTFAKDATYAGLPRIMTGYDNIGHHASYPSDIPVTNYQIFDALSVFRGRHSLRVGTDLLLRSAIQSCFCVTFPGSMLSSCSSGCSSRRAKSPAGG